jgi:hypothetical protein
MHSRDQRVSAASRRLAASHTRAVRSSDAVTMRIQIVLIAALTTTYLIAERETSKPTKNRERTHR